MFYDYSKGEKMIPKKIHYFWFGQGTMGALSEKCLKSWSEKMPDYEINLWNESNLPYEASLAWTYIKKKEYAFASDFARYYILHKYGGIYLDTDVEVIRKFDDLLSNKCFLGYEDDGRLNSAVIGAEKSSSFVEICMDIMKKNHADNRPYLIAPELANRALKVACSNVTTYPKDYFYPYNPYSKKENVKQLLYCDITENTYSIHHWEKKWKMNIFSKIKRMFISN